MATSNRARLGWSVLGASLEEQDDNHRECGCDQTAHFDPHEFSECNSIPLEARRVPRNRLTSSATDQLVAEKFQRYRQHPNWSYQLHTDNLVVLIEKEPTLGAPPSYTSVLRFM